MATTEHCLFCFETLDAKLNKREPLSLEAVQRSYAAYQAAKDGAPPQANGAPQKQLPALRRLTTDESLGGSSSGGSSASASSASLFSNTTASPASYASAATSATSLTSENLPAETPLFITWNKDDGDGEYDLRGCIGTFAPLPLELGLAEYALTAALEDTRFHPVRARELPALEVAVTLLTDFEKAAGGIWDWELGTHGLRIAFEHNRRRYGATYLPDVAPEQGWTKEETLASLMRKAGWLGRREGWLDVNVDVVRYQGKKHSVRYAGFKQWRDWHAAQNQ